MSSSRTTTTTRKYTAHIMHANWLTNAEFDSIASGNLNSDDQIGYRCAKYPEGYDSRRVDHIMRNYKQKIPGLKIGLTMAYYDLIVAAAPQIKKLGVFDFVGYNQEADFDGPPQDSDAKNNLEKIRKAADAVHAQGMKLRLSPTRQNTLSFKRTGLLDDVARFVDMFHQQAQALQDNSSQEYSSFTGMVARAVRAANPSCLITSQVSPAKGPQPGKTLQQTMRDCVKAAISKPYPGNTVGASLWIRSEDVAEAKSFFTWFRRTYPSYSS
jgi:hypothetical protein